MEILLALFALIGLGSFVGYGSDDDMSDRPNPLLATDGDDTVVLGDGADIFDGLAGDDSIDGGLGSDTLYGRLGEDTIDGGSGKDVLFGGNGVDTLFGENSDDTLYGDQGFDNLYGGSSDDTLFGGRGKDLLEGGTGSDALNGGDWHDGLFGGSSDDSLSGGDGEDILVGGSGQDTLNGGSGDDLCLGGLGEDLIEGERGDDLLAGSDIFSRGLTPVDYESVRSGTLRIYESVRSGTLPLDEDGDEIIQNFTLSGKDSDTATDTIFGGAGDDTIFIGNADIVSGGEGSDEFVLGDWIEVSTSTSDNVSLITDFKSGEDVIVVAIDDTNSETKITTEQAPNSSDQLVYINGNLVARVQGTFDRVDGIDADIFISSYAAN